MLTGAKGEGKGTFSSLRPKREAGSCPRSPPWRPQAGRQGPESRPEIRPSQCLLSAQPAPPSFVGGWGDGFGEPSLVSPIPIPSSRVWGLSCRQSFLFSRNRWEAWNQRRKRGAGAGDGAGGRPWQSWEGGSFSQPSQPPLPSPLCQPRTPRCAALTLPKRRSGEKGFGTLTSVKVLRTRRASAGTGQCLAVIFQAAAHSFLQMLSLKCSDWASSPRRLREPLPVGAESALGGLCPPTPAGPFTRGQWGLRRGLLCCPPGPQGHPGRLGIDPGPGPPCPKPWGPRPFFGSLCSLLLGAGR